MAEDGSSVDEDGLRSGHLRPTEAEREPEVGTGIAPVVERERSRSLMERADDLWRSPRAPCCGPSAGCVPFGARSGLGN